MSVIDVILILSPSSSEPERGFSQLKLIKTNLRTKLNSRSLNETMAIRLLSSEVKDFNPQPAIDMYGLKAIRPTFKDKAPHFTAFKYTVESNEESAGMTVDAGAGETAQVPAAAAGSSAAESDAHLDFDYESQSENDSGLEEDEDEDSLFEKLQQEGHGYTCRN